MNKTAKHLFSLNIMISTRTLTERLNKQIIYSILFHSSVAKLTLQWWWLGAGHTDMTSLS